MFLNIVSYIKMKETNDQFLEKLLNDSSFENWVLKNNKNDIVFWSTYLKNNPDKLEVIFTARSIVGGILFKKNSLSDVFVDEKFNAVLEKIQLQERQKGIKLAHQSKIKTLKIAIASIAAIFLLLFAFNGFDDGQVTYKTGFGETLNLKLADGTSVVLNGNSEISYQKNTPREVKLSGEAYFIVKSIPSTHAKFWVLTDDIKVEVYGTQFNVRSRGQKTDVLLDEGIINLVLENGENKQMIPGELVSYSKEHLTHKKIDKSLKYAQWKNSTYIFNNMPLEEVMKYIEDTYGLPSQFENSEAKSLVLSGGIPNENLNICLTAIQKSVGVQIQIQEDKLIIN